MRPARLGVLVGLVAAGLIGGCGDDRPRGVTVTEAEDEAPLRPARPSLTLDTVYADSGLYADPSLRPDSLRRDSLRRDSLRADSTRQAAERRAGPDFRTFWPTFRAAVETGPEAVRLLAATARLPRDEFDRLYDAAFGGPPFRDLALALTPRDFRTDGTAREARLVIGYDTDGNAVPQDEATTESSVTLRFEVVDGAYRLVAIERAG